jgi:fatty-acyl-CoA synthase
MQDFPLTIVVIMRPGVRVYGASECVTWSGADTRRTSDSLSENRR